MKTRTMVVMVTRMGVKVSEQTDVVCVCMFIFFPSFHSEGWGDSYMMDCLCPVKGLVTVLSNKRLLVITDHIC